MRVQLRDRNPARGVSWRYGRGRGRYPHSGLTRHYLDSAGIVSHGTPLEKDKNGEPGDVLGASSADEGDMIPAVVTYPTLLERSNDATGNADRCDGMVSPSPDDQVTSVQTPEPTSIEYPLSHQASPQSSSAREALSQYGGQDWNNSMDSSTPLTPAHSSYASSAASGIPSVPYAVPNMGYYQQQPWMPSVVPQFPYPMPYIAGYAGYPLPSQLSQSFNSPCGSESSGPNAGSQVPWAANGPVYPVCTHCKC
jgi:hypothetical protein